MAGRKIQRTPTTVAANDVATVAHAPNAAKPSPRDVRLAARVPQIRVAVMADVSEPLVRLYEANPTAVKDEHKRQALDRVYADLAARTLGRTA